MSIPFDWSRVKQQIDALLTEFPELIEDDVLRADMIEGSTDLHTVIAHLLDREREAASMSDAVKIRRDALGERGKRYDRHSDGLRATMLKLMQFGDLKTMALPEATVSVRAGSPRVIVTDETMVPEDLCRISISPDKKAIKERIDAGEAVPGAVLSNSEPSLTIRTK
jgi:hypothetical protein